MKDKEKQFKERIDCGIAYCEDTAINEIRQDFKMQEEKHKQIEEMAEILLQSSYAWWGEAPNGTTKEEYQANTLYNADYRKLPKDSIVISREEYEMYKTLDMFLDGKSWDRVIKDKCKETAEKFAKALKEMAYQSTDWSHGEHPMVVEVDYIDEVAEKFGVEIKE